MVLKTGTGLPGLCSVLDNWLVLRSKPGHSGNRPPQQNWEVDLLPGFDARGSGNWEPKGVPDAATSSILLLAISLRAVGLLGSYQNEKTRSNGPALWKIHSGVRKEFELN